MKSFLNDSFFRFTFGFLGILGISFMITFAVDQYAAYKHATQSAATFIAAQLISR